MKKQTKETENRFSKSFEGKQILKKFTQRLVVANRSGQTVKSYMRAIEFLMDFHDGAPSGLEIDQVIDYLHYLKEEKELKWRTLKIYVAGLRWYYQEIQLDEELAAQIPYPKEEKTLPKVLSREELALLFEGCQNDKHRVMFRSARETLKEFAQDKRQGMQTAIGAVSILHTWTQKLVYHPHIHCIVPNGGISKDNKWKKSKGNGEFLFYVPNLALKFRGKFLDNLYKLFLSGELKLEGKLQAIKPKAKFYGFKDKLYHKKWVINCKKPFNGPKSVLEYLGRYTHKIAIGNYRILNIDQEKKEVTFSYLDRNDNNKKKTVGTAGR